jgi:proteasome lid subunit RPN8/RPN11
MIISELLSESQQQQIRKYAIAEYENDCHEACGLLLSDGEVYPCENKSESPQTEFVIESSAYAKLERERGVACIWHSHTNGNSKFTAADVDLINRSQKILVLYDVYTNEFYEADPSGKTPLIGRQFLYGIYDCYSLIRDYYQQERGIEIPNYPRSSDNPVWDKAEWDWIDSEYERVGFRSVKQLEVGDVLAMSIGRNAKGINHLAIYLGEDKFMHQLHDRKSNIDVWGGSWNSYTIKYLRYKGQ